MRKIRAEKEFVLRWSGILTNGKPESLEGRDLTLYLVNPYGSAIAQDIEVENNTIAARISAGTCNVLGQYRLKLYANKGKSGQTVLDNCEGFLVVATTCQEGDNTPGLEIDTVELSGGDMAIGIQGRSAYEIAVANGFEGTEAEWLESLKMTYSDLTPEQIAELQRPATESAQNANSAAEGAINATNKVQAAVDAAEKAAASAEQSVTKVEEAVQTANATNEAVTKAEEDRVLAENQRVSAEDAREQAEAEREATFTTLQGQIEEAVENANGAVTTAEGILQTAQQANSLAQGAVESANQATQKANQATAEANEATKSITTLEANIESAETKRVSSENSRVSAEAERESAEESRKQAEQGRATAEQGRVSAESNRTTAEQGRASAEQQRVTEFATLKQESETATTNANEAAEKANKAAEGIDEKIEGKQDTYEDCEGIIINGTVEASQEVINYINQQEQISLIFCCKNKVDRNDWFRYIGIINSYNSNSKICLSYDYYNAVRFFGIVFKNAIPGYKVIYSLDRKNGKLISYGETGKFFEGNNDGCIQSDFIRDAEKLKISYGDAKNALFELTWLNFDVSKILDFNSELLDYIRNFKKAGILPSNVLYNERQPVSDTFEKYTPGIYGNYWDSTEIDDNGYTTSSVNTASKTRIISYNGGNKYIGRACRMIITIEIVEGSISIYGADNSSSYDAKLRDIVNKETGEHKEINDELMKGTWDIVVDCWTKSIYGTFIKSVQVPAKIKMISQKMTPYAAIMQWRGDKLYEGNKLYDGITKEKRIISPNPTKGILPINANRYGTSAPTSGNPPRFIGEKFYNVETGDIYEAGNLTTFKKLNDA